ncbi:metallophosphoesterase family protein [Gillisia sp. M10.2A]|uniref:Metallophosphoesterase family protein n=1 Tax=Gillisia lutea TaxID=2909668 RepID=A0ABS9EDB4_9FLAO|nr:metallophosphoesterase family protein [Gillisia lutea]MCF4100841.1 metallophosphoesterase family protein [Gillisia lutea]
MDKPIEHLGQLKGKVLLFGGVYSNLQALEALISIANKEGVAPSNCICTGDIIGYCGQPQQTISLFKKWGAKSIVGNVEIQLAEDKEDCGCDFREGSKCDDLSQLWYPFAKAHLQNDAIEWIKTLPRNIQFDYAGKTIGVVHGAYSNVSEFIFSSTSWEVKKASFDALNCDVIVAGHCGLPFTDVKADKIWINPGVIGMPANDGLAKVWAVILDERKTPIYKHFSFSYDHELASELMLKNNLPKEYAQTLKTGIWDNTEILPIAESELQGKPIKF